MEQDKEQDTNDSTPHKNEKRNKRYVDEVTQRKIALHLSDINDTISDEDIKNINTDISSNDSAEDENDKEDETNEEKDEE